MSMSLIQQHVATSKGHLQASGIKCIKENKCNCKYFLLHIVIQRYMFSFMLYDDALRLKHVTTLKM